MKTNQFKRIVAQSINPKAVKDAIRANVRKRAHALFVASMLMMQAALNDLLGSLAAYRLGAQIKPTDKDAAKRDLGSLLRALVIAAKALKVRVPPAQRRIKVTGTILDNMIALEFAVTSLFSAMATAITGTSPGPVDHATIRSALESAILKAYTLSWALLGIPASEIMASQVDLMKANSAFPESIFAPPAPRPVLNDEDKAKAAKARSDAKAAKATAKAAKVAAEAAKAPAAPAPA